MLPKTIIRRVMPRFIYCSFKVNNTKTIHISIKHSSPSPQISNNGTSKISPVRLFSSKADLENIIVDFDQVKKATGQKEILIVDVREPDEVKEHGKIPNSINIPLGNVSTVLGKMSEKEFEQTYNRPKPSEESEIIFYCMIGKRSGMAQQNALNLGYKNVKNYLGSWTDWAAKGQ